MKNIEIIPIRDNEILTDDNLYGFVIYDQNGSVYTEKIYVDILKNEINKLKNVLQSFSEQNFICTYLYDLTVPETVNQFNKLIKPNIDLLVNQYNNLKTKW